jgi:hypothetical protein
MSVYHDYQNVCKNLGMMAYAYNPSIQEAKAGGSWVPGQPGIHSGFETNLEYTARSFFKKPKRMCVKK